MESSLSSTIRSVSDRVDRLSETVYGSLPTKRPAESGHGPSPAKKPAESGHVHWTDRTDLSPSTEVQWSDEEGEGDGEASASGTIVLSEHMSLLHDAAQYGASFDPQRLPHSQTPPNSLPKAGLRFQVIFGKIRDENQ